MSKIIVFEGADRCGKATQSNLLKEYLVENGSSAARVEVPIRDNHTYKIIYWMLRNGLAKKLPKTFQWLQYLNRLIFQTFILPRLEKKNEYIVFDRWSLSTVVYGVAEGVSKEFCEKLYNGLRRPDFTIILLNKSYQHEAEDVYESDLNLQKNVRNLYADWAVKNLADSYVIDNNDSKEKILSDVVQFLKLSKIITQ